VLILVVKWAYLFFYFSAASDSDYAGNGTYFYSDAGKSKK
jgi:hypothetical protein